MGGVDESRDRVMGHDVLVNRDIDTGDLRTGLACYQGAIARLHAVRALALEATATSNAGRVHDILGHPQEALDHYRQVKNILTSYDEKPMGFF